MDKIHNNQHQKNKKSTLQSHLNLAVPTGHSHFYIQNFVSLAHFQINGYRHLILTKHTVNSLSGGPLGFLKKEKQIFIFLSNKFVAGRS